MIYFKRKRLRREQELVWMYMFLKRREEQEDVSSTIEQERMRRMIWMPEMVTVLLVGGGSEWQVELRARALWNPSFLKSHDHEVQCW